MQISIFILLVLVLVAVVANTVMLIGQSNRAKKFDSQHNMDVSKALDYTSRKSLDDGFHQGELLRQLVTASSTMDTNQAAFGVINTLLMDTSMPIEYASLLIWTEGRKSMNFLGTNVGKKFGSDLLKHINEVHTNITNTGTIAHTRYSPNGTLNYPTAKERDICFEYYIPIYRGTLLIGALHIESTKPECNEILGLNFFNLVIDNISLVLYNIVLMQKVLQSANTDNLTKLYNRTYLRTYMDNLKTLRSSYSIIMCDIDFFKKVNDTYGHATGDKVLAQVAAVLMSCGRANFDGAFRYGGEEFLLVLRDAPTELVLQRAEQLRTKVESLALTSVDGQPMRVSVSIGVHYANLVDSTELNISHADAALYYSKQHGRNRVTLYSPEIDHVED